MVRSMSWSMVSQAANRSRRQWTVGMYHWIETCVALSEYTAGQLQLSVQLFKLTCEMLPSTLESI